LTSQSVKNKIALGTVQFGLAYGINNKSGKPSQEETSDILNIARKNGVTLLDGNSLDVIGLYLSQHPNSGFEIISKFTEDDQSLSKKLEASLERLRISKLYGYMYHRFDEYQRGTNKPTLLQLKEKGLIERIGVSVYDEEELAMVVDDSVVDFIQIPFNVLDSSEEKMNLFRQAKKHGKEIHVRSIFLQGLFFKHPNELTGNLIGLKVALTQFNELLREFNLNITQLCLNYALYNPLIDRVIIGVEKAFQLEQNLDAVLSDFPAELLEKLDSITISDRKLLNPSNWKA